MENKTYPLKLDKNNDVVAANDLMKGKQKMTLREAQLLYLAISNVVMQDKDFKTYTTTVKELAAFMGYKDEGDSLYRDLKGICAKLRSRTVIVRVKGNNAKKDKWKVFGWIDSAEYEDGKLTLRLSDDIKPYLLELNGCFSSTRLYVLLAFESYYAVRLYQYLWAERNQSNREQKEKWVFTIEQLRELFQIEKGKYKQPRDLLKKTIIPALKELEASPYFHYWGYKENKSASRGKALLSIEFEADFYETQEEKDKAFAFAKRIGDNDFLEGQITFE